MPCGNLAHFTAHIWRLLAAASPPPPFPRGQVLNGLETGAFSQSMTGHPLQQPCTFLGQVGSYLAAARRVLTGVRPGPHLVRLYKMPCCGLGLQGLACQAGKNGILQ